MNDKTTVSTLKRVCMSIGALPTSYLDSMSYYEMLVWFTKYLTEEVTPAVNNNAEAVIELQNYVEHYFDNLDVETEVENKLDEMAEDGTLQELIAAYLDTRAVFCFDNVAQMQEATNLIDGSYTKTLGFYDVNDGGNASYKVRTITNDDVVDNMRIIELANNSLIAELVIDENTNVKKFGAKGDDSNDDTASFNAYIDWCNLHNKNIHIPVGQYRIYSDLHNLNRNVSIVGEAGNNAITGQPNSKVLILDYRNSLNFLINYNETSTTGNDGNSIFNVSFTNKTENELKCINFNHGGYKSKIENCSFSYYLTAIYIKSTHGTILSNVNCRHCGGKVDNSNTYAIEIEQTTDVKMTNCMMEYCRWNVYTHNNANNFVMEKCYFEIVTAIGYKGNEPLVINGGNLSHNYFCTRPAQTIATAIDDTLANVYHFLRILNYTNLDGNIFSVGGANDGTTDSNKKQGKYLNTNESGTFNITNNYFQYTSFESAGIKLEGRGINFDNNVVMAYLEEVIAVATYRLIDDSSYYIEGDNIYYMYSTLSSANQQNYIPRFDYNNNMKYMMKSVYSSSFDTYTNNIVRSYTKCATLVLQGSSGIFDLEIQNKSFLGTYYKASISYNVDGASQDLTVLNTEVSRLAGTSHINFIKGTSKLIIQFVSTLDRPLIFRISNKTSKITEYNVDIDEIASNIIYTVSNN